MSRDKANIQPSFYFEFGSPNAYLAHRVIPSIEQRNQVRFTYGPALLGGLFKMSCNQSPMMAFANIPLKLAYERREMQRFIEKHGLTKFRMNPHFPVNTLARMRGAMAAEAEGILALYVEARFHYMGEEPRKLEDLAVLAQTLNDAKLPAERLMARAQEPEIKDKLMANTQAAHERGVFGLPSFLVGDELYFGKDRLPDVEAQIIATQAKA